METISASRRYRHVSREAVRRIGRDALARSGGDVEGASKRTKRALHQVYGAFLPSVPRYDRMLRELDEALAGRGPDSPRVREVLRRFMSQHASSRERLRILDRFWSEVGARIGRPDRVLDLGCGLNPLAVPWMGLPAEVVYDAVEIDGALLEFLRACLTRLGVAHDLRVVDLLGEATLAAADVALVLKLLPTLEQQREGSGERLLEALPAPIVVVSFPTRSLGQRSVGMEESYTRSFEALLERRHWRAERVDLAGELVYVVKR